MRATITALRDCGDHIDGFLGQLALWHHQEWLHLNHGATFEQRLARYQQSLVTDALPEIFIAHNDAQLLGSVSLEKIDMDTRKFLTPWLASLYVEPANREQGIASKLIEYVVSYAEQQCYKNLYLFTEDQTDFYQHRGWHFVEMVNYRQADVDLMCRKLEGNDDVR